MKKKKELNKIVAELADSKCCPACYEFLEARDGFDNNQYICRNCNSYVSYGKDGRSIAYSIHPDFDNNV